MPKCPNGTRKNKQGVCTKYEKKVKAKTPTKLPKTQPNEQFKLSTHSGMFVISFTDQDQFKNYGNNHNSLDCFLQTLCSLHHSKSLEYIKNSFGISDQNQIKHVVWGKHNITYTTLDANIDFVFNSALQDNTVSVITYTVFNTELLKFDHKCIIIYKQNKKLYYIDPVTRINTPNLKIFFDEHDSIEKYGFYLNYGVKHTYLKNTCHAPQPIVEMIQVKRTTNKCPKTFKYNKKTDFCEKCPEGTRKVGQKCLLEPSDDIPGKETENIVLPAPYAVKGISLKDLMNKLETIGKKNKDPSYSIGLNYMPFIYIYLIKKYATQCAILSSVNYTTNALNYNVTTNTIVENISYLSHKLKECIERGTGIIFIPITLSDGKSGHANLLIYRPFKKMVERYEPHGQKTRWPTAEYDEDKLNAKLTNFFKDMNPVLGEYTPVFKTPHEICPRNLKGFQGIENLLPNNVKENGYCQLWSMFMMETILLNPTLNTEDIIEQCIHIGKEDPLYFKNVIRGYTQQIAKEMKIVLGKYIKDIEHIGTPNSDKVLNRVLSKELLIEALKDAAKPKK